MRAKPLLLVLLLSLLAGAGGASEPQKVILDISPLGDYDDLVTLWIAALSPELDLLGVIVGGEPLVTSAAAAAKALRIVGREDVGVYPGLIPQAPTPDFAYWSQFPRRRWRLMPELGRFAEGETPPDSPMGGAEFYLSMVARFPGEITIMVTHPLTTLAEAMRIADRDNQGQEFRAGIRQVYFSGGDISTSEYNIYMDIPAARLCFESRIPLYQFGGEDSPKAYFRHPKRKSLWLAETPLTRAMQNLYRYFNAGYDPTSPFVPILYDAHLPAYLIAGERICRFEETPLRVGPDGHLVAGEPDSRLIMSRVENHGAALVDFVVERLSSPYEPARNHLRTIEASPSAGSLHPELPAAIAATSPEADPVGTAAAMNALAGAIDNLPEGQTEARKHAVLARQFLLRESGNESWRDPYTDSYIPLYLMWVRAPKRKIAVGFLAASLALVGFLVIRQRWISAEVG